MQEAHTARTLAADRTAAIEAEVGDPGAAAGRRAPASCAAGSPASTGWAGRATCACCSPSRLDSRLLAGDAPAALPGAARRRAAPTFHDTARRGSRSSSDELAPSSARSRGLGARRRSGGVRASPRLRAPPGDAAGARRGRAQEPGESQRDRSPSERRSSRNLLTFLYGRSAGSDPSGEADPGFPRRARLAGGGAGDRPPSARGSTRATAPASPTTASTSPPRRATRCAPSIPGTRGLRGAVPGLRADGHRAARGARVHASTPGWRCSGWRRATCYRWASPSGVAGDSLYFEIRVDNRPEDPLLWLREQR